MMSNVIQSTEGSFVYQLKRATDNKQDILIHFSASKFVTVLGSHGKCHVQNMLIDELSRATPKDYRVIILQPGSSEVSNALSQGRPLQELIWMSAYLISDGKLLPGCQRDDVIQLNMWPNLTRLVRSPNMCRIAALFSARPTSIELAARILAVPLEEMFQFYSAASYAGYTTAINRPTETLRLKPHRRQSLIKKLMVRLTQTG